MKHNKKSQVFIFFVAVIVVAGLVTSWSILHYMYKGVGNVKLGSYQSGIVDTLIESEKSYAYTNLAAKYAVNDALIKFGKNGGIPADKSCNTYVYNLWNIGSDKCYPSQNTFSQYISEEMNEKLSSNSQSVDGGNVNFKKPLDADYIYETSSEGTTIKIGRAHV